MKRFFETPEVSSVELNQTDVIMDSSLANANSLSLKPWTDDSEASDAYKMWKGLIH